jgi:hypothetical protein
MWHLLMKLNFSSYNKIRHKKIFLGPYVEDIKEYIEQDNQFDRCFEWIKFTGMAI